MPKRRASSKPKAEEVGDIVTADDGLPAVVVNEWTEDKHYLLREYLRLQSNARRKWLGNDGQGATYIDLFCGAGMSKIRGQNKFIDGSAVLAWNSSRECQTPFTAVYIADLDKEKRRACYHRLQRLGAPVVDIEGSAHRAVAEVCARINPYGLHFAFLDPFNLESLDLEIIRNLARFQRMDILVHLSAMDVRRNAESYLVGTENKFEGFAPGWTGVVNRSGTRDEIFRGLVEYWQSKVDAIGVETSMRLHAMRNFQNQVIYWLLLLHRHELAEKFWNIVLKHQPNQTRELFDDYAGAG